MRYVLLALALVLVVACGDAKPIPEGHASVAGHVLPVTPIPSPDSEQVWAAQVIQCIGRGSYPTGVRWYVTTLPKDIEPLTGYGDWKVNAVYLDYTALHLPQSLWKTLLKHEMTHLAIGWKADHPGIPPTGRVDHSEPRQYFNRRCGTR